jgi:hypothetical protein
VGHIKSIFLFPSRPSIYKDLSRRHILFVMALDRLFLVVRFRTTASIVSYMATLARLYMSSDVDFQVWSVLHSNKCFFKSGDARMSQVMAVPL